MYINNFIFPYNVKKDENKCGRIFRPWDCKSEEKKSKDNSQDCTVSTTTQEDEETLNTCKDENIKLPKVSKTNEKEHIKVAECFKSLSNGEDKTSCSEESRTSITNSQIPSHPSKLSPNISSNFCLNKHITGHHPFHPSQHILETSLYEKQGHGSLANPDLPQLSPQLPLDFMQDSYNPLYPDLLQTNLAHHLGLPPNDPLILESLAQGYALEEYTRVLNQEQQAKLLAAKKQRPKKYKCPHCDVGFSNNGQLKGHIRIHTGERPFKCDDKDCGKTFTRNEELTRHKRIHSGLRPFPCTHCGKRFGRKDHLKKHSRTHFQPRGLYAVPVVLPFEAWASGQTNGYPFFPMMY